MAPPSLFLHDLAELCFCGIKLATRAKIVLLALFFVFFFAVLLVVDAILLVSEIPAKKAVRAVAAVEKEGAITAIAAIEAPNRVETVVAVDQIARKLTIKTHRAKLAVTNVNATVDVLTIFAFVARMAKVAVFAVPPIVGVFAVLVTASHIVSNGAVLKKPPKLVKEGLLGVVFGLRRISMLHPLLFVPDWVGAMLIVH